MEEVFVPRRRLPGTHCVSSAVKTKGGLGLWLSNNRSPSPPFAFVARGQELLDQLVSQRL